MASKWDGAKTRARAMAFECDAIRFLNDGELVFYGFDRSFDTMKTGLYFTMKVCQEGTLVDFGEFSGATVANPLDGMFKSLYSSKLTFWALSASVRHVGEKFGIDLRNPMMDMLNQVG